MLVALPKSVPTSARRPTLVAVLDPVHRQSLERKTEGIFGVVYAEGAGDLLRAMRAPDVRVLLLSTSALEDVSPAAIRQLGESYPAVQVGALVLSAPDAPRRLLELGTCGLKRIVDLSDDRSWDALCSGIRDSGAEVRQRIEQRFEAILKPTSQGAKEFFYTLFATAYSATTVLELAAALKVLPSTLISRFYRAGLPSPKRYLALTRILYAVAFFEDRSASVVEVSERLRFSSPQSFGRNIHTYLGVTAGKLRNEIAFEALAEHFTLRLISSYMRTFRHFDPFGKTEATEAFQRAAGTPRMVAEP